MEATLADVDELLDSPIGVDVLQRYVYWLNNGIPDETRWEAERLEAQGDFFGAEELIEDDQRQVAIADAVLPLARDGKLSLRSLLDGSLADLIGPIPSGLAAETSTELVLAALGILKSHHPEAEARMRSDPELARVKNDIRTRFAQFDVAFNRTIDP
jgi:hypothetical protein